MSKLNNEDLLITYIGNSFNQTKTAKALGTTKQTINRKVKSPEFQALLTEYRKNCSILKAKISNYNQRLKF